MTVFRPMWAACSPAICCEGGEDGTSGSHRPDIINSNTGYRKIDIRNEDAPTRRVASSNRAGTSGRKGGSPQHGKLRTSGEHEIDACGSRSSSFTPSVGTEELSASAPGQPSPEDDGVDGRWKAGRVTGLLAAPPLPLVSSAAAEADRLLKRLDKARGWGDRARE